MKKTSDDRFKILISMLKRHEKACNESKKGGGIDHDLSNVRYFQSHIEIDLKDGKLIEISGSVVKGMGQSVFPVMKFINWAITCG